MNESFPGDRLLRGADVRSIDGFADLAELALDLRWSWNHSADSLWRQLDERVWKLTRNPWAILQIVSRRGLQDALSDPNFRNQLETLLRIKRQQAKAPAWFQKQHPQSPLRCIAYFSMEFMLGESLPIYSGGLGNVAGDQLKAAGDLGVPVVGVGLLYQQGYFRQSIDRDGMQQAMYPYNDPGMLPVSPVRQSDGRWLRLEVKLPGYSIWLRAWEVQVGRCTLYLLDSNDPANDPAHRSITSELYGGNNELRLQQELVLGIGGWRLLKAVGLKPEVCHLNEGHAAFAVLERAKDFMAESKQPFEVALAATRVGNLFTTHTAVPAGFDRFAPQLVEQYLSHYAETLGLSMHDLLALGRVIPNDSGEPFNMAYLAVRGSGAINGVSALHGQVSRQLFAGLFPRWPLDEVPIAHVTNGVHVPSWDSAAADDLWTDVVGSTRWLGNDGSTESNISRATDEQLWQLRTTSRTELIEYARGKAAEDLAIAGGSAEAIAALSKRFDPQTLTLCFARRFATYKRPNLLLHDADRLLRLLTNSQHPVQLVIAGKAHPADGGGRDMIRQWIDFIRRPEVQGHVVFLTDYDVQMAERLVGGVDVWVNTPRRPWEASGTSGMKVLVNGGLNLSELDGWWAEAFAPELGWALGDGQEHGDDPAWDAAEAKQLYEMLECEIVPMFYDRDASGLPVAWLKRVRQSMAQLTPQFSADRTVRQYTEQEYLPAAKAVAERIGDLGRAAAEMVRRRGDLEQHWRQLRIDHVEVTTAGGQHRFVVHVNLGQIDAASIVVELFAVAVAGLAKVQQPLTIVQNEATGLQVYTYHGGVAAERSAGDFTVRIKPNLPGVTVPLECPLVLWS